MQHPDEADIASGASPAEPSRRHVVGLLVAAAAAQAGALQEPVLEGLSMASE